MEKNQHTEEKIETTKPSEEKKTLSRRRFIGNVGGTAALGLAAGSIGLEPLLGSKRAIAIANEIGPETPAQRLATAFALRVGVALRDAEAGIPNHPCNGDEENLPNFIGNYSKGLRHDSHTGEVIASSYEAFLDALEEGTFEAIESLATNGHLGCPDPGPNGENRQRRQVNPMAAYDLELETKDSHQFKIPAAPAFRSAEEAGEMVELYWMALLRDVNFNDYATNPLAQQAAADLSQLSDFRGPKVSGQVTPQTLFRDNLPGATVGPYISQFLMQIAGFAPYGSERLDMRIRTARAGIDFGTNFNSWFDIQRGCQPAQGTPLDGLVFCRNGRDIGQYVHVDALYQAYQVATLILLGMGLDWDENNPYGQTPEGGAGGPLPNGVPGAKAQVGFGTFGGPAILTDVCEVATRALRAIWFQKWLVHRRLRPEAFGGRVEVIRLGRRSNHFYGIHQDLFNSSVLPKIFAKYGSHLLPLAFAEGSPLHPAYGAGHATVAGACVTVAKAFFDEDEIIPNPVVASADGRRLDPFIGPPLTVGGELNKLASNIATGRNIASVHWRTDGIESLRLGEEIAINLLSNMRPTFREPFQGYKLRKFNGQQISITSPSREELVRSGSRVSLP